MLVELAFFAVGLALALALAAGGMGRCFERQAAPMSARAQMASAASRPLIPASPAR
jgi:hypothetical protein